VKKNPWLMITPMTATAIQDYFARQYGRPRWPRSFGLATETIYPTTRINPSDYIRDWQAHDSGLGQLPNCRCELRPIPSEKERTKMKRDVREEFERQSEELDAVRERQDRLENAQPEVQQRIRAFNREHLRCLACGEWFPVAQMFEGKGRLICEGCRKAAVETKRVTG
jgi:hypothetical protein